MLLATIALISAQANPNPPIPQTITVATETLSLTSDGKPSRCEIDFSALNRDDVDGEGKMVAVKGTFGLELIPGTPLYELVKLSYQEVEGEHLGIDKAPFSVSLIGSGGASNASERAYQSLGEDKNSILAGFPITDHDNIIDLISHDHRLKLLFNRDEGYGDVLVDVDLMVLSGNGINQQKSGKTLRDFARCAEPLLAEAERQYDGTHKIALTDSAVSQR